MKLFSCVQLFVTLWTGGCQALYLWDFQGKNTRSELQLPSSGDLPNPRREPMSPELQADSLPSDPPGKLTKNKHKTPKN